MAIAGKVAITLSTENGGAWSADVTYDRLVAVKHNNNLYISRKTVANVEPPNDEFWFLALEGFGGEDVEALIDRLNELSDLIQAIIDGTTQVGNAKTLDGHGAEDFAKAEQVSGTKELTSSILEKALTLEAGVHEFMLAGGSYNGNDLPKVAYAYGNATVFVRQQAYALVVVLWGSSVSGGDTIALNQYDGSKWQGWNILTTTAYLTAELAKYLPLDGSVPISRMLTIGTYDLDGSATLLLQNKYRNMYWQVLKDGRVAFCDASNSGGIKMEFSADGQTNTFVGHASKDLPLDGGGTVTSNLDTPLYVKTTNQQGIYLGFTNKDGRTNYIGFDETGDAHVHNKGKILHTGNMASHVLVKDGGGTVSADNTTPVRLQNTDGNNLYLQCLGADGNLGFFGFVGKDRPVFIGSDAATVRDLLHTGNGATYEEGTFDLTLEGRTLSGYKYTKIGNFVYLSGTIPFNGEPLTIENTTVEVHGLPFGISSIAYIYFGDAIYTPSNKATDSLVNYVSDGTYFGIGGNGTTSFAVGTPCVLHAMYITD